MTDHACDRCGDAVDNKNAAGWYRDHCWDCIEAVADAEPAHRETCDESDCPICTAP